VHKLGANTARILTVQLMTRSIQPFFSSLGDLFYCNTPLRLPIFAHGPQSLIKEGNSENEAARMVGVTCPECARVRREHDLNSPVGKLDEAGLRAIYEATML
jgi:hypothetical protein